MRANRFLDQWGVFWVWFMVISFEISVNSIISSNQILLRWWNRKLSFATWGAPSADVNSVHLSLKIYRFNSENSFNWTKIFTCINPFSRSFQSVFEIKLINCLWWSISHWFGKIVFKVFLSNNLAYSNRTSAFIFTLRIKHHESRILSNWNSLRISLNLLRSSWRKLMALRL